MQHKSRSPIGRVIWVGDVWHIWTHSTFANLVKVCFDSEYHIWHCRTRLFFCLSLFYHHFLTRLFSVSASFCTHSPYSAVVVWLIDDYGYWLTVYTFVQRLPVFLGSLLLAGLELRSQGWTYRDYGDVWMDGVCVSECMSLNRELWVSIDFIFFYVDMCSTLLNDWMVTLFCLFCLFVWHLNKVHPTLTYCSAVSVFFPMF